jgi:HIV-1 Vpr-binding protein
MKMDPDPFDERHPSRADPDCALGHILKVLFRKDSFMNKVTVNLYIKACFKKFHLKTFYIYLYFHFCMFLSYALFFTVCKFVLK